MADKRIQDLTPATSVQTSDMFVLEQGGQAKSLTGQILINDLAAALDGHGGISNISYTAPTSPSLSGTMTITMVDETEFEVPVTNGRGITGITWATSGTAGNGMLHTGTIAYNDGTTSTMQYQDGVKGNTGAQSRVWFKWANNYPTSNSDMQSTVGPYIGIYSGTASTAPSSYTSYTWYQYKGNTGDPGSSIQSIALTSTSGLVDTYTITLTNGGTSTFTVTNAKSISSIEMTSGDHQAGTTDIYTITFNDGDTSTFSVYNGANGEGAVSTVSGIQADGNGNVPQVISGNGPPTTSTVGTTNQLYYDKTNSVLYYCAGSSGNTYVWQGAGVTVDSALSGSSTNPVQNKIITGKVGTASLTTTATNLSGAVNELDGEIGTLSSLTTSAKTTIVAAVNEVDSHADSAQSDASSALSNIGTLASLSTTAKTNLVAAINEVDGDTATNAGNISTLSGKVGVATYNSVTQLSLTSGTATIAGAWAALPENSALVALTTDFDSTELPSSTAIGTVFMNKTTDSGGTDIGYIELHYNTSSYGDYRQYLLSGVPTGTWVSNTHFKPGEVFSVGRFGISGFITASTKDARFTIIMPKSLAYISTISVTQLTGGLRGISGYVNSSTDSTDWTSDSAITISATKDGDYAINLVLTKSSAYSNATNNTPVNLNAIISLTLS